MLNRYMLSTRPRFGWNPPNNTALFGSTLVNVNASQGGGLEPVTGEDDKTPGGVQRKAKVKG